MSYILSCCSTADLSKEHFLSRDIHYVCFHYALDGVEYPDDLGESIPFDEFYDRMSKGADTRTAQVNVAEYVDFFTPFLEDGKDIVHVSLSSGISGSINAARNAAAILRERYPERKIYVIDSLGASSGSIFTPESSPNALSNCICAALGCCWDEGLRLVSAPSKKSSSSS